MAAPASVDDYLATLPAEARKVLEQVREVIRAALPDDAQEGISYAIPTFKLGRRAIIWFAAYTDHYSIYPATDALREQLGDELAQHFSGKGTIRFDLSQPVPAELIERIVQVRLAEEAAR